jgi:hypothetical protein
MEHGSFCIATGADAPAIVGLIRECYGDTHPVPECLDAVAVARAIEEGEVFYAMARDAGGASIGQAALERLSPFGLYECGRAIVSDSQRRGGLFGALGRHILEVVAPAIGARYVVGRVVTSHLFAQKFGRAARGLTSGILLGMFPEGVSASGIAATTQPISAVVKVHRIESNPRPRNLTLEGRDGERALAFLGALGVPARRRSAPRRADPLGVSVEHDHHFGVAHLRFGISAPTAPAEASLLERARASNPRLIWADVPAEHPAAPALVARLRELGLGLGAYLPAAGVLGEDVLRLQCYLGATPLDRARIHILEEDLPLLDEVWAEAAPLREAVPC